MNSPIKTSAIQDKTCAAQFTGSFVFKTVRGVCTTERLFLQIKGCQSMNI